MNYDFSFLSKKYLISYFQFVSLDIVGIELNKLMNFNLIYENSKN